MKRNASFHAQLEKIFSELALSSQWGSPLIIAISYLSAHVQKDMERLLQEQAKQLGMPFIALNDQADSPLIEEIQKINTKDSVFSLSTFGSIDNGENTDVYQYLNLHREFFIEKSIRLILWLNPEALEKMTTYAPDFWAFRHLVIDLTQNRATPGRYASAQGVAILSYPWIFSDTDIDNALSYRERTLSDLPKNSETTAFRVNLYGEVGALYFQKGDLEKALDALREALSIIPEGYLNELKAQVLFATATLLLKKGNAQQAEALCQRAIPLSTAQPEKYVLLAQAQRKNGKNTEALKNIERALKGVPKSAQAWNEKGNIYLNLGRFEKSMNAYQEALKYELRPEILINQAILLFSAERKEEAKKKLQEISCDLLKKHKEEIPTLLYDILDELC